MLDRIIYGIKERFFFDRYSLVQFYRQLATLSAAGFGLLRGIRVCAVQTSEPRLISALKQVKMHMDGGHSFSSAMKHDPLVFDSLHVNMVKSAETAGNLPEVLENLACHEEREMELRARMKSATSYPMFIFIFSVSCIFLLIRVLAPIIETITGSLKGDIPIPTRILMFFSGALSSPVFYIGGIFIFIMFAYFFRMYYNSPTGKLMIDNLRFNIPIIGPLYKKALLVRICRVFRTMLEAGVPAVQAVELVGEISDNFYIQDRIVGAIYYQVLEGSDISTAFGSTGFFPKMMVSMMKVGEESGSLPETMQSLSNIYSVDVEYALATFYATLEPLLIIVMGLVTFTILLAAFLPIYQVMGSF